MKPAGPAFVCSVLGWSNSGKTTLIEASLALLASRGIACAALKVTKHPGSFNLPGKDTSRFLAAGAEAAILGGEELVLTLRRRIAPDRALLARLFPEARVVFVEGARIEKAPCLLAIGEETAGTSPKFELESVDAIASARATHAEAANALGIARIASGDAEGLLAFLEDWYGTSIGP